MREFVADISTYKVLRVSITMSKKMKYICHSFQLYNNCFDQNGKLSCCYTVPKTVTDGKISTVALVVSINEFIKIKVHDISVLDILSLNSSRIEKNVGNWIDLLQSNIYKYHLYQIIEFSFVSSSPLSVSSVCEESNDHLGDIICSKYEGENIS